MYAFAVILFAMMGNAQVFGVDLALVVLAPVCLFLFFLSRPRFSGPVVVAAVVLIALAAVLTFQATRVDVFKAYYLWPLKALLVCLLVSPMGPGLDRSAFILVGMLCGVLFVTSVDQLGRSYGLFGPNMLYRFYGLLLGLCLLAWLEVRARGVMWGGGFALLGVVTTGSAGGAALVIALLAYVFNRVLRLVLAGLVVLALLVLAWPYLEDLVLVERIVAKIDPGALLSSTRVVNAQRIFGFGFAFWGQSYATYADIWQPLFLYPHNVFIELVAFFGVPGMIVSACLVYAAVDAWVQIRWGRANVFTLVFICILVGSCFSAELSDNYGCIGLAFARVLTILRPVPRQRIWSPSESQAASGVGKSGQQHKAGAVAA